MNIFLCIILSLLLAGVGYYKKAFTYIGLLGAFIISVTMCYCGGLIGFIALTSLFIITITTDKIGKKKKKSIENDKTEKNGKRDIFQILANLFIATVLIIIYKLTNNEKYLICFLISIAESAADTSASGIGILANKTYNILTLKKSEKGLSGNISVLGLITSFLAALLISFIVMFKINNIYIMLIIAIFGFLGGVVDSILGCFQSKYKCCVCNKVTEKSKHCGKSTSHYKGLKHLNNDLVNFLSNLIICLTYIIIF